MMALKAIKAMKTGKSRSDEKIVYQEFPEKKTRQFELLLSERNEKPSVYQEYIGYLNELFGEGYKTNRKIDRALWVYGHCIESARSEKK